MKGIHHPSAHLTIDELLGLKLQNLINQRDKLNLEIKRIELAIGTKPKPLSELKNGEKRKLQISIKDARNSIIRFGQKKRDYFTLNEVKRQCFPNEFNALTIETRREMTAIFNSAITQLKTKKVVEDKPHPQGMRKEKSYFIKEEALKFIKA